MKRLRIAMTLSGAVSLGAFEGGALAALLLGLQALEGDDRPVVIDVMSGASAGSITALLSAWVLLQGANPVDLMAEAWVTGPAIDSLRARDTSAPLSGDDLAKLGARLFTPVEGSLASRQKEPVTVSMALASLRGFGYHLPSLERLTPIEATSYMDWKQWELSSQDLPERYTQPADASPLIFSLASGANAMGFPPVLIDRSADEWQYGLNGVTNFPQSDCFWYTDGGTIDNEPLGRTIALANAIDQARVEGNDEERLHLLIHPHPTAPPVDAAWSDPKNRPTWTHTLMRALHVGMTQSLYDDLHQMEKTNSRLQWRDALRDAVTDLIKTLPHDAKEYQSIQRSLQEALAQQARDQAEIRSQRSTGQTAGSAGPDSGPDPGESGGPPETPSAEDLLGRLLDSVAGLVDKQPVKVEVISPLIMAQPGQHVEDLLAGEFLAHFGGFVDVDLRWSDFALGYDSMLKWMEQGWTDRIDNDAVKTIRDAAGAGRKPEWSKPGEGTKSLKTLGWRDKLSIARLAVHIGHVIEHDLRHPDKQS
jgi:predicted acylesterase/phospholipase RssA